MGDGYVQKVTGFSNSEEEAVGKTKYVPFLLEDKLKELGGLYERGPDWVSLISRKNPPKISAFEPWNLILNNQLIPE
jgi:hypothetical protein